MTKNILFIFLTISFLTSLSIFCSAQIDENYQYSRSGRKSNQEIRTVAEEKAEMTIESLEGIEDVKKDVVTEFIENLQRVKRLEQKIREANIEDRAELLDDVYSQLEEITIYFEKTTRKESEFERKLHEGVVSLDILKRDTTREIEKLRHERRGLGNRLKSLREPNPKRMNILQASYEKQIHWADLKLEFWEAFQKTQAGILGKAEVLEENVVTLLLAIEENAKVFRGGLEVLGLYFDFKKAMELLSARADLEGLTNEIVTTWSDLESLLNMLTEQVKSTILAD